MSGLGCPECGADTVARIWVATYEEDVAPFRAEDGSVAMSRLPRAPSILDASELSATDDLVCRRCGWRGTITAFREHHAAVRP